uniref:Uncharacterized protein n=1 Tax=Craspedostauros australis TaxID=1486917 RepID=A0A7R9ZPR7_9STRA|mmetsp:Transcript_2734/g.7611  ORF Transcript_2734/g.7611 Transcript_2734/m.7611 type:complete len:148 (+) Transcript_2734:131-574(+)
MTISTCAPASDRQRSRDGLCYGSDEDGFPPRRSMEWRVPSAWISDMTSTGAAGLPASLRAHHEDATKGVAGFLQASSAMTILEMASAIKAFRLPWRRMTNAVALDIGNHPRSNMLRLFECEYISHHQLLSLLPFNLILCWLVIDLFS